VAQNIRFMNPKSISKPPGYTHVVEVTGPGRTVYIAGQLLRDRYFNISAPPAITAIGVPALAVPGALVEIEAIVALSA
jgi:enamine deaminase RidA (YjgF/YER057c/UK114 family)